ncbi:MAG: hypothetical protein ACOYKD_03105 [Anaerolineaceae bacterium]|jgi:DNA-binding MarR family transcriptional regulator
MDSTNQSTLNNIADSLLKAFEAKRDVPNYLIYQLTECIITTIRNRELFEISDTLGSLIDKVDKFLREEDKKDIDPEENFNVGRLFALTSMIKKYVESQSVFFTIPELVNKYSSRYKVFESIGKMPGITHQDLADCSEMSASALSQLMVKLYKDKLVTANAIGRHKYYYLTSKGNELLTALREKNLPVVKNREIERSESLRVIILIDVNRLRNLISTQAMKQNHIFANTYFVTGHPKIPLEQYHFQNALPDNLVNKSTKYDLAHDYITDLWEYARPISTNDA